MAVSEELKSSQEEVGKLQEEYDKVKQAMDALNQRLEAEGGKFDNLKKEYADLIELKVIITAVMIGWGLTSHSAIF